MHVGSKLFVFVVFVLLGTSFWITTGLLYWEFSVDWRAPELEGSLWFDLLTHYSHMFLFFPLFGTVALFAFFLPAVAFVDMYWRRAIRADNDIPYARLRFLVGLFVLMGLAWLTALGLQQGSEIGLWQISAQQLRGDAPDGTTCAARGEGKICRRVTFAVALENVRRVSQDREQLTDLKRKCDPDPLIEPLRESRQKRFCFVTARYSRRPPELRDHLLDDPACCKALSRFEGSVRKIYVADEAKRSLVDRWETIGLPFKAFFLYVLLLISILLAGRRRRIESQYADVARRIDRGVLIGAFAMLFLPFMNHAYLLSTELLYGPNQPLIDSEGVSFYRVPHALSVAFGIWGLFILLFFIHREDKDAERMSKIIGTIASGIFVLQYDTILNYAVRFAGPGAGTQSVAALMTIAIGLLIALVVLKVSASGNARPSGS